MPKTKEAVIDINSPVGDIKGVGPKKVQSLGRLGIFSLYDVLEHYPRSYEDRREAVPVSGLKDGQKAFVRARVLLARPGRGYGRKRSLHLLAEDDSGRIEILFFSAGFMMKTFKIGEEYCFFGKVKVENGRATMFHPTWSEAGDEENSGILPVYPLAAGLSQKELRRLSRMAVALSDGIPESLPQSVLDRAGVCGISRAYSGIHYPQDEDHFREARYRLVYEELFDLKAMLILSRRRFGMGRDGCSMSSGGAEKYLALLPYKLTGAQRRALDEILADMKSEKAMNRLVQGDVGSGKTAVAAAAISEAVFSGRQAAFMAPTELLAEQHYKTLKSAFFELGFQCELLTGSLSAAERKKALARLASGESMIAVGTHALISEGVEYNDLGLVITDEQHRFGVNQRRKLSAKGGNPDVLVMTATPIPRTLAVVLFADLDISVIDELPPGRQPIKTMKFAEKERKNAYRLLLDEVKAGHQAYVVAPFIDDPEDIEGHSAESLYAGFTKAYPDVKAGLLHGAMPQKEKNEVMSAFGAGEISVLISTVVIEVGIDVANATVMLIENSERFGLAQLHQLRGRVGRGKDSSYCLLVVGESSELAEERADTLCGSSDGFKIAEKDLDLRGPGEFFGLRQHGLPQLRLADPVRHLKIAESAGRDAAELLEGDPSLAKPENHLLAEKLQSKFVVANELTL